MYGYIRFCKGELKIKEYETYRAIYCSLCKNLGKNYGVISRLTLSYDFTFLAVLNYAVNGECHSFKKGRCAFNPLKKCNYCGNKNGLKMPSGAAMIMNYYKILDNISDNRGFKKLGYILIKPIFSSAHKKAAKEFPEIEKTVCEYIKKQNLLEKEKEKSVDKAADPTAAALSEIFALCSDDQNQKRVLSRLGYCLGRYIYLLDAACDFERDKKSGNYNVFSFLTDDIKTEKENIKQRLYVCANEAARAFELIDFKRYKTILGNIVYLGLEETFLKELGEIKDEQSV